MQTRLLLFFLLLVGVESVAQPRIPVGINSVLRPGLGERILDIDPATGILRTTDALGNIKSAQVDSSGVKGLGKKQALQDQTINKRTSFMTLSQLQSLTTNGANAPPDIVNAIDSLRGGVFIRRTGDAHAHDGYFYIRDASNNLYVRQVLDRRITPQMFGAYGDGIHDDSAALLAWITYAGVYELYLPAGTYRCGIALIRYNMGAVAIRGAGSSRSRIVFTANVEGIVIINERAQPNLGLVQLEGVSVVAGANMNIRTAIRIDSQHEQQPGVLLRDVTIDKSGSFEWPYGVHLHDCSSVTVDGFSYNGVGNGSGQFFSTGILISNTVINDTIGRPAVNYDLGNLKMTGVGTAVVLDGKGKPAIEGVTIRQARIVSCNHLLTASSATYPATLLHLEDVHSEGYGYAVDVDNIIQVQSDKCLYYISTPPPGVTVAPYSVRINKAIMLSGNLKIIAFAPIQTGVDITGSGTGVMLDVTINCIYGETHGVRNAGASFADIHVNRIWSGSLGVNTGKKVYDVFPIKTFRITGLPVEASEVDVSVTPNGSGVLDVTYIDAPYVIIPDNYAGGITAITGNSGQQITLQANSVNALTVAHTGGLGIWLRGNVPAYIPPNGTITLRKTNQKWQEIARSVGDRGIMTIFSSTTALTATVNPNATQLVSIEHSLGSTFTLILDNSTARLGQRLIVSRYSPTSSGPITISTSNGSLIQNQAGTYASSVGLPMTTGARQLEFIYNVQGYWQLVGAAPTGTMAAQDASAISVGTVNASGNVTSSGVNTGDVVMSGAPNRTLTFADFSATNTNLGIRWGGDDNYSIRASWTGGLGFNAYHGATFTNGSFSAFPALRVYNTASGRDAAVFYGSNPNNFVAATDAGGIYMKNNLEIDKASSTIYMKSPNGSRWAVTITNAGTLSIATP